MHFMPQPKTCQTKHNGLCPRAVPCSSERLAIGFFGTEEKPENQSLSVMATKKRTRRLSTGQILCQFQEKMAGVFGGERTPEKRCVSG